MRKFMLFVVILLTMLVVCNASNSQIISRFAGDYINGYSGDGGADSASRLYHPAGICADGMGNVYIVDFGNFVIRKVNASGIISTIAGTGVAGYSGDGGLATAAEMHPTGVSADSAGNIYIADGFNNVIRKIDTAGIITTIAGTTTTGYSGDGGPATEAKFDDPNEVRVDRTGNLYIADSHNNVIRKINTSGIITTFAGNGYNAGTGLGGYAGDGGPADSAELFYPEDVAIDNAGNVYIAELYNHTVRKVNTSGIITTVAGTNVSGYSGDGGPATAARLSNAYSVAVDSIGNLYIADETNNVIRNVDTSGIIHTYAGNDTAGNSGDGGPAIHAEMHAPTSVTLDQNHNLYISDFYNNAIRMVGEWPASVKNAIAPVSQQLVVYPNPAEGIFILDMFSGISEETHFVIANMLGQTVKEITSLTNKQAKVVLGVPPGIYFVTAVTAQGKQSAKIVVR